MQDTPVDDEPTPRRPLIDDEALDAMMDRISSEGMELLGPDGVLTDLTKRLMERAMDVELSDHLGHDRGDPRGRGSGNAGNGTSPKRVLNDADGIPLDVPRKRNASFEPKVVPQGAAPNCRLQ